MYPVASVVLCIVVAVGYILFQIYSGTGMVSLDFGRSSDTSDVPVRKDSVVFITDGAKGVTREAAVTLATYGYHVLIGVKSEAEKKSFLYENGKGIESIVFDIADPATLPAVVYRIREIHRDFERPLSGVVINSFDYVMDNAAISTYNGSGIVDIKSFDKHYKALVKGPLRLLEAIFELVGHQNKLDYTEMRITAINRMLGEPQQTGAECSEEQGSCPSQLGSEELRNNNSVSINDNENMNGLRIVNLATKNDEACGGLCILQATFMAALDEIQRDARKLNLTTSIVEMGADFLASGAMMGEPKVYIDPSKKSKKRKSKKKKRSQLEATKHDYGMMVHRYRQIQQYVQKAVRLHELDDGPNPRENISLMDSLKKIHLDTRSIIHSMISKKPRVIYLSEI